MHQVRPHRAAVQQGKARRLGQPVEAEGAHRRQPLGAEAEPGGDADQLVHQIRRQKRAGQGAAALAEDAGQPRRAQLAQRIGGIDLQPRDPAGQEPRAQPLPGVPALGIGARPVAEPERHLPGAARQLAQKRKIEMARDHHPHRLVPGAEIAHRQGRIVGAGGAGADHHRIVARAHGMDHPPRLGPGDPAAFAGGGGDAPVETAREL